MADVEFTQQAVEDLKEIGRYTKKVWGLERARRYRQELELGVQKLSLNPNIGKAREEIAPAIRSFRLGSHIAFYQVQRSRITVVRLLHSSMDIELAFQKKLEKASKDGERER